MPQLFAKDVRRLARAVERARQAIGDKRAGSAIIFALAAPLVVAGATLSAETGFDYYRHTRLQAAADAAAFAGALEKRAGTGATVSGATSAAAANGWSAAAGAIQVNSPPTSGAFMHARAVEVVLSENLPRFFSSLFISEPLVARARAVAVYQSTSNACVLALNRTVGRAVQISGSANMNLVGCDVVANSVASDAINVWGSAEVTAACVSSAGGVANKGGLTLTDCPSAITQAPRTADPFAGLPVPTPGAVRTVPSGSGNSTMTLSPGWYMGGMSLNGKVTLQPGVYYVSGGDFRVNGSATITGTGVTIFLAAGSEMAVNGDATLNLTAPTSGTYAGMLFFGDPSGSGGSHSFNGSASTNLTGNLYFPTQQVNFNGDFSGGGGCMHIVADTVIWTGSATMQVDCSGKGMASIPTRATVRLVE